MKKPLSILLILIMAIIIFFVYRGMQEKKFKAEFRHAIQSMPEKMRGQSALLPNGMEKIFKPDVLVTYPKIYFYIDVQGYKEKTLPPQALENFQNQQGWICKSFFDALKPFVILGSKREQKLFFDLIKTENISVDMKFRNAFGEDLYTEQAVLAQCPEYTQAIYFSNNN